MLLKKLCNYKIVIESQTLLLILHFVKVNIIANTTDYCYSHIPFWNCSTGHKLDSTKKTIDNCP